MRFYDRRLYASEALQLGLLHPLHSVLELAADQRTAEQKTWLRTYFLQDAGNPAEKQLGTDQATLKRGLAQLNREIPSTMVMAEMDKPRETYVLLRGDYRNHGDKVEPNTPAVLPPLPKDAPRNRLTLAKLAGRSRQSANGSCRGEPLLADVLRHSASSKPVRTSVRRAIGPSNQDLLDWLATEFIRTNWDVKAMQRLIVTSAVYRQAVDRHPGAAGERSGESPIGPRPTLPPAG